MDLLEAKVHATELEQRFERESQAKLEKGLREARERTRSAMAAAVVTVLVSFSVRRPSGMIFSYDVLLLRSDEPVIG